VAVPERAAGAEPVDEAAEARKIIAALCIVLGGVNFFLLLVSMLGAELTDREWLAASLVVSTVLMTGSLLYAAAMLTAKQCPAQRMQWARWSGVATGALVVGHQLLVYPVALWGRAGAGAAVLGAVTAVPAAAYVILSWRVLRPEGLPQGPLRLPEMLGVHGGLGADERGRNE
jgi:hypothetical protein